MRHLNDISSLIRTLRQSSKLHALIVQSPPGWAKSSTIDRVLKELGVPHRSLGSYSTPLALYNSLCEFPDMLLVLDDCVGIFGDGVAMSILKAATWPSSGSDGQRLVTWNSTTDRAAKPSVNFTGKLLMLTNAIPGGKAAESFVSRALYLSLKFTPDQIAEMLREAAQNTDHYQDPSLATTVAEFLISQLNRRDSERISLRTLQIGYELAKANPDSWRDLLEKLLPTLSPNDLHSQLGQGYPSVSEQVTEFVRQTGLSRRTFFNYKKRLKMAPLSPTDSSSDAQSATCTFPAAQGAVHD